MKEVELKLLGHFICGAEKCRNCMLLLCMVIILRGIEI